MSHRIPEATLGQIHDALFASEKIRAIKIHREATGSSLGEAKDAIDAIDAELRASSPERFKPEAARAGCVGLLVASASIGGAALVGLLR
jgi:ribosomal protein L7/L12